MLKRITKYIFIAAVVIAAATLFAFALNEFNDPERVFTTMLGNHLSSQGVTRTVNQESSGQSLVQTTQAHLGEENIIAGRTELSQGSGDNRTEIVTESVGTPTTDYVRYVDIITTQQNAAGQAFDFSNVLGVWGSSGVEGGALTGGELFSEAALGVVPLGNLPQWQNKAFVERIKELDVYEIDYSQVERRIEDGRPVYTYTATVKPERYVTMLKEYAGLVGVGSLDATDPALFRSSPELNLKLAVDVWSRHLTSVEFAGNSRSETYGSYGLMKEVAIPEETISIQELQARLQSVE